jgi:hypothetical protein
MNRVTDEHLSTADFAGAAGTSTSALLAPSNNGPITEEEGTGPLLPTDFVQELRGQWDRVQTNFVDEPRAAVKQADELVAQAMKRLAETFADARNSLEHQWDRGDDVSTEDLRVALRKYRSFFRRLLSV